MNHGRSTKGWWQSRTFRGTLLVLLLVAGLTSCAPDLQRYEQRPATCWSGIWHGVTNPIRVLAWGEGWRDPPQIANTTSGYLHGFRIGRWWLDVWSVGMAVVFFFVVWADEDTGCIPFLSVPAAAIGYIIGLAFELVLGIAVCLIGAPFVLFGEAIIAWADWFLGKF